MTTAHEGATHLGDLEVMKRAADGGATLIDVIAYPFITDLEAVLKKYPKETWGNYENRLKIGGVKITIDGSPQGKTAYFTTPYLTGGPGGEKNWSGELTFPEEVVTKAVKAVYDMGVPLNLHANGDGAIDAFLRAHEKAAAGDLGKDRQVTMIHSQFVRKDQLDKYVTYKIRPSFYTLHTYYFAEAHIANRGREQAMYLSPMRDAIDKGLVPTNHTDFVVAPLDQMFMMWSAVNRLSRGGEVIGADQRVTPIEALKAMTINVAQQYGEAVVQGLAGSRQTGRYGRARSEPVEGGPDEDQGRQGAGDDQGRQDHLQAPRIGQPLHAVADQQLVGDAHAAVHLDGLAADQPAAPCRPWPSAPRRSRSASRAGFCRPSTPRGTAASASVPAP